MQNPLPFYSDFNTYSTGDAFLANAPDASVESDVFAPTINTHSMPVMMQPTMTNTSSPLGLMTATKKRKATFDTDASYSPVSTYSDNSNYSDASYPTFSRRSTDLGGDLTGNRRGTATTTTSNLTTSAEEGSSDDNDEYEEENDLARKREKHTQVEAQRRALEKAHFKELSMLITNRQESKSTKLHHLDLLKIAADQISEMNLRHKHDPLRPSNLTDSELNFLTIEASNSFIFVMVVEPSAFPVIYVTDSINRVLNLSVEQWKGHDFLSLVSDEDRLRVRNQLLPLHQHAGMKVHIECRLQPSMNSIHSSVIIDGMTKMLDQQLKPLQSNTPGFLAFVGICHLPLITKYSETNMSIYNKSHVLTFRCRCSPNDWKIFLVDRSVSNLQSVSYDLFRQKSILDFIPNEEQMRVHQVLLRLTMAPTNETIPCHFIHPLSHQLIPMSLEIRSFFNQTIHRADFLELTFKGSNESIETKIDTSLIDFDLLNGSKEIDQLFESELGTPTTQQLPANHPLNQSEPFYYPNEWPTLK